MDIKGKIRGAWKSLTIWFNGVLLAVIGLWPMVADALPQFAPYLDAGIYKIMMVAALIINLALRFKTNKPLQDK